MRIDGIKNKIRGFLARDRAIVLTYHSVQEKPSPFAVWHHLDAARFEEQIAYAARHRRCLSLAELLRDLNGGTLRPYSLTVTFDDGFANNLHVALPILRRHGVPATFFLTAGYMDSEDLLWPERAILIIELAAVSAVIHQGLELSFTDAQAKAGSYRKVAAACKRLLPDAIGEYLLELARSVGVEPGAMRAHAHWNQYRMLSWQEARTLAHSTGVEIGAHTINHTVLTRLAEEGALQEVAGSKRALEARGMTAPYFAYPNGGKGDFSARHRQMAIESGYSAVFTAIDGCLNRQTDRFEIPRYGIGADMTFRGFVHGLSGGLAFAQ